MSLDAARKIRLIMELRGQGVSNTAVLSSLERVPREAFVPSTFADQAYENTALPIGLGQTISQPLIVGLMSQALEPDDRLRVLEIGTGSGYQTAVLSKLFRRVYTIERHKQLLRDAEARLKGLGVTNLVTRYGDGMKGWPEAAPFDRVIVTAAAPSMPEALLAQLSVGGVMVLPLGDKATEQWLLRIRRTESGYDRETVAPVRFVPLVAGLPEEG